MSSEANARTRTTNYPRHVGIVYFIFFLSGVAALVYEVSWSRQVGLLLGHTAHAAAVVLTAYFAGLSIGYLLGAKLAEKTKPLRAYAIAEFAAAAWACIVPLILSAPLGLNPFLYSPVPVGQLIRWSFCFLLLLPATAAMGTTLPLLAEWLSPARDRGAGRVVSAYAFNTAGALAGIVAATVWLLGSVGVSASGFLAAGVSAACGVTALILQRHELSGPRVQASPTSLSAQRELPGDIVWSLLSVGISGFGILALEVLLAKLFALIFHNSTYTFGAVLAAVVLALAVAPPLARLALRRIQPRTLLGLAAGAGAIALVLSLYLFALGTRLEYFRFGNTFAAYIAAAFGVVASVVLPPLTLLGMILPTVWFGEAGHMATATMVGRTLFVNSLAGAAGAATASLFLLPTLGLWASFGLVSSLFALLALGVLSVQGRAGTAIALLLLFGIVALPLVVPPSPERWASAGPDVLVRRWNSVYGWIDVMQADDGTRKVRQNLHYRFGTTGHESVRAYRQAHLPLVLHPLPTDVLFLGLGTGLTAGGAIPHAEVERAVVVELIPEVVNAARLLGDANFSVVDHPKVEVQIGDARHFIATTDRRFDVIVSDLFVPSESETGYLYTVEHYQAARRVLKPSGLFCQWLPVYQVGSRELELIADSFASVFPETTLWWGALNAHRPIIGLVGSDGRLQIDQRRVDARLSEVYKTAPIDEEMKTAQDLVGRYVGHWRQLHPERLNTDEFPRVEFLTPVSEGDGMLLHGETLRTYYDDVLARLPVRSERFSLSQDRPESWRAWHRLMLFQH